MYDAVAYMTVGQAAKRLGVSDRRIRQLCQNEQIESVYENNEWIIERWAVEKRLQSKPKRGRPKILGDNMKAKYISDFVGEKIDSLYKGEAGTDLSHLMKGLGKPIAENPESWGIVLKDLDESMYSEDGVQTDEENAIWAALTIYALHQFGNQEKMSDKNISFGKAINKLISSNKAGESIIRQHLKSIVTSSDLERLSLHAKGLIKLLSEKGIAFDYQQFAADIYNFQFEETRQEVLLRWISDSQ